MLRINVPVLLLLLLSGCGNKTSKSTSDKPANQTLTLTDDADRSVSLQVPVNRVIPLAPNLTELLFEIGAGSKIAAVSTADNYPPQVEILPRYSSYPMDYEALVAHKPDVLIATDAINNPRDASQFTSLGLPVLYYSFEKWQHIPDVMRKLGELTGTAVKASQVADSLEFQLQQITTITETLEPVSVLFLIGPDQLYAFGKDNYIHEAIAFAGGASLTSGIDTVSPILSEEFVITSKPDMIIGTFKDVNQLLVHHPSFRNTPAIKAGRFCHVEASLVLRPGPRLLDGIKEMAKCIHPTLFPTDPGN